MTTVGSNTAPFKSQPSVCRRAETQRVRTEHRPIQSGAELRFPPFAHRAFGCLGDRRRGRSVENARPLSLWSGSVRQSDRVTRTSSEADSRRHESRPLRDQWHGVDGAIHALSTATIPNQSSRGGQRVGNPHGDLGRSPFGLSRTPYRNIAPFNRPGRFAEERLVLLKLGHFSHVIKFLGDWTANQTTAKGPRHDPAAVGGQGRYQCLGPASV